MHIYKAYHRYCIYIGTLFDSLQPKANRRLGISFVVYDPQGEGLDAVLGHRQATELVLQSVDGKRRHLFHGDHVGNSVAIGIKILRWASYGT